MADRSMRCGRPGNANAGVLRVKYNANVITQEQLVNLLALAGLHVGIGEGRPGAPKNTMDWGQFHVATDAEVEVVE